jgi:two-component system sensor histidine kinase KdpD
MTGKTKAVLRGTVSLAQENLRARVERPDPACLAVQVEPRETSLLLSIAHDLRAPLACILASATWLRASRQRLGNAAQDELMDVIQHEAKRLERFIANLVDLARIEAGAIQLHPDSVDILDVIDAAMNRASMLLAGHRVVLEVPADLPLLQLNPVLLEQVLFNLLDNASKYALPGTEVRLRAEREADSLLLRVLDEGPGIEPSELERIFDKFYRIRSAGSERSGIGLGLSICRGFVELMDGTIEAANRPGRTGSVFTISLPVPTGMIPGMETPATGCFGTARHPR